MHLDGVGPVTSCCSWIPCPCTDVECGWGERFSPRWRMVPGVLALAATVVAVVCALIWNCPYLCIAFVPGILASLYLIYLGWDFQNLTTFAENNDVLKNSVATLEEKNGELQKKLDEFQERLQTFEEENKRLEASAKNLSALLDKLKSENFTLTESNEKLKNTIEELKSTIIDLGVLKETLEKRASEHVQQLEGLQNSLRGIQTSAQEDHTTFSKSLASFIAEVEHLQEARTNFEKAGSSIEEKMKTQVDVLSQAAIMLQEIFTKVNQWKDVEEVERRIKLQQLLQNNVLTLEKNLSLGQGQLEEQAKQIQELAGLKEGFGKALANLVSEIDKIDNVKGELAQEVVKAAAVFKNYDFRNTN